MRIITRTLARYVLPSYASEPDVECGVICPTQLDPYPKVSTDHQPEGTTP